MLLQPRKCIASPADSLQGEEHEPRKQEQELEGERLLENEVAHLQLHGRLHHRERDVVDKERHDERNEPPVPQTPCFSPL
ncbi:MAG: hypothetical protein ACLFO1_07865 [Spirochaetaceae bacterium]